MPNIQPYNSRVDLQGTQIQGKQAEPGQYNPIQQLDQGIRGAGEMLTAVALRSEQEDVSDLHVNAAQFQERQTKKLLDQTQKGTLDPDQFQQEMEDDYEQNVRSKVNTPAGQNLAKQMGASLHLDLMTSAFKSKQMLAGDQAVSKFQQGIEASGNAVMSNPASFQSTLDNQDAILQTMVKTKGLPASEMGKLQNYAHSQIALGYYRGMIKNGTPEQAQKLLNDDSVPANKYIGQHEKYVLMQEAKGQIKANLGDVRLKQEIAEHAKKLQQEKNQDQILKGVWTNSVTQDQILNSDLNPHVRESLLHLNANKFKTQQVQPWGIDEQQMYSRIIADDGDPNKLRDEASVISAGATGKISHTAMGMMLDEMKNAKDPTKQAEIIQKRQLIDQATRKLNPASLNAGGLPDIEGAARMRNFMSMYQDAYQKGVAAGKTPSQLLTPGTANAPNPDYLGNLINLNMPTSGRNLQNSASRIMNTPTHKETSPITRLSGESTADYLKRVKESK